MSGHGAPQLNPTARGGQPIAIVASQWHDEIMSALIAGAYRALEAAGVTDIRLIRVPGAFELPLGAQHAARSSVAGVIALGVVIRGGTPHFEYVCQGATEGLTQVALSTNKPVGFGLLTVDNEQQALDRAGLPDSAEDKGAEAAQAVLATLDSINQIAAWER